MTVVELPTPALTVDLDVLEANLNRMAKYCRQHDLRLRPHAKTHKTPEVAKMQIEYGAAGITVAKVGEAEIMAASGLDDILVAYPIFGWENVRRLATLAHERRILVSFDNESTAQMLSAACVAQGATIGALVELDSGFGRCGLSPGASCTVLAKRIEELPGLRFRGLMSFFGNVWGSEEERRRTIKNVADKVEQTVAAFADVGMQLEIVSGGSTPSALLAHEVPGLTEIRPGTYCYHDLNDYYLGLCTLKDCALRVVTTVVSTAIPGHAIVDAGSKTLSSDLLSAGPRTGYGLVTEAPDVGLYRLNEEHGYLDTSQADRRFHVGDVLTVIPNHVCTCVNLHDEIFLIRSEEVVGSWRIAARGKVR